MDNSIYNKLKAAGVNVPEQPKKTDKSKVNMQMKLNMAQKHINDTNESIFLVGQSPDEKTVFQNLNAAAFQYLAFCESVRDILMDICKVSNIQLSDDASLSELLRKTSGILNIPKDVDSAVKELKTRNDLAHEYLNTEYHMDKVRTIIENHYSSYIKYINILESYCKTNNII